MKIAHLNGLRAFEAVLRTGNFRLAAQELSVTPAAVGQQVRALENYLDRKLFIRNPKGVEPTNEAKAVQEELVHGLLALNGVLEQLRAEPSVPRLSLTTDTSIGDNWLAIRLAQFHALGTGAAIEVRTTERVIDLTAEDVDFAIRFGPEPTAEYEFTPLFRGGWIPVCTPEFAKRYSLPRIPKSLIDIPLLDVHEETADPSYIDWPRWCELHGIGQPVIREGLRFKRLSHGLQAARAGLGLALCGLTESYEALRDGSLIMPFSPEYTHWTSFEYRLVSLRSRHKTKVHRQFRDWIAQSAAEYRKNAEAQVLGETN